MEKVVVTGGAGFIGSHVAEALRARGFDVVVVDNLSTGNKSHILEGAQFIECDINDTSALVAAFKGATTIFHVAAIPGVPVSIRDPEGTYHTNVEGTKSVMRAAEAAGVTRVIFSSSAAVYGNTSIVPTPESAPTAPLSPYGVQKLEAEHVVLSGAVEGVVLRYFNVFGPRQDPHSEYSAVIPLFVKLMREGKEPRIYGSGEITRDYTYVSDVVAANILAATTSEARGCIFNIACGEEVSLAQLVAAINTALGTAIAPSFGPAREGDISRSCADISRAQSVLGYNPQVAFEEGISRTIV
jgi:UDP-glucose 4-epimerase